MVEKQACLVYLSNSSAVYSASSTKAQNGSKIRTINISQKVQLLKRSPTLLQVFQWQICSDSRMDSHRFKDCIQNAISSEKVKR